MSGIARPVRARATAASLSRSTPATSGSSTPGPATDRALLALPVTLTSRVTLGSTSATLPSEATSRVVDAFSAPARISACLS